MDLPRGTQCGLNVKENFISCTIQSVEIINQFTFTWTVTNLHVTSELLPPLRPAHAHVQQSDQGE